MKKTVSIFLVMILMTVCIAGCGEKRNLYNGVDLNKYISELGEYKGIKVDTKSEEFAEYYDAEFNNDVSVNGLYTDIKDGVVQKGDIVNLDYAGKIDGVAFEGGTAEDQELEIGSKTFIDDFEDELIGAKIGETRDVTAKFPENYGNEELNGKEAVFTCKINGITRAQTTKEAYKEMDFDSEKEYIEDITKRAVKSSLLAAVRKSSKIKDFPSNDNDKMIEAIFEYYVETFKKTYNADLEEYLTQTGSNVDSFKQQLSNEVVPEMMQVSMLMYSIFDIEELELLESTVDSQNVEQETIAEFYAIQDTVLNYLYENADIK